MNASIKLLISAFIFGIATSCGAKEKKSQPIIEVKEQMAIGSRLCYVSSRSRKENCETIW
jgi:hypothetical protein